MQINKVVISQFHLFQAVILEDLSIFAACVGIAITVCKVMTCGGESIGAARPPSSYD